jgi:alpha-beta hydrolase superfamily lysophospholipase
VKWREGALEGVGGLRLYRQAWVPDGEVRAVVVIVHGISEHSGRYHHVAARLVADGYAVHAHDQRGHGRSEGPRAVIDRMDHAVEDADRLVEAAGSAHHGAPVVMLGHSVGGLVAVRYALVHGRRLTALALSGPLAALEAASPATRLGARVLSALTPRLGIVGVDSHLVSRDPEVVRAYESDPLVYHGKLPARTVAELEGSVRTLPERVPAITVPTLIMYGSADWLCPPAGSLMLNDRIGAADRTLKVYDGLYHEIFNEPERDRVLDDLSAWLRERVALSGAGGCRSV